MLLDDLVKGALITIVSVLHIRNIKWRCIQFLSPFKNVLERNINEFGILIHKSFDQPGASDPINLRTFSCNPFHSGKYTIEQLACHFRQRQASRISRRTMNEIVIDAPGLLRRN
jgi:methionine synthase I (cobalamin-dependent)